MTDLEITREGAVETWALNRPRVRNALNPGLVSELRQALSQAEVSGTRTVVLTGNGPSFCAGADLLFLRDCAVSGRSPRPFLHDIGELTVAMESSKMVFIAALHGHAVAGGLELALACDVVVAAAGTLIGDGHVLNNLLPGGGASVRMPGKLGYGTASWLALSGSLVAAERLVGAGWLHDVVAPPDLMSTARALSDTLSSRSAGAQTRVKSLLTEAAATTRARLAHELDVFEAHWQAENIAASLGAFLMRKELDRV